MKFKVTKTVTDASSVLVTEEFIEANNRDTVVAMLVEKYGSLSWCYMDTIETKFTVEQWNA